MGEINNTAYLGRCLHAFCFSCILSWAATRAACLLCRQPFHHVLHTARVDDDYQQSVVNLSACRQQTTARERARSRSLQPCYHPRPRPNNGKSTARRWGPAGRDPGARGNTWEGGGLDPASTTTCSCCKLRLLSSLTFNKDPEAFQSALLSKPLGTLYANTLKWLWGEV